jgi:hypothetical protein
MPRLLSLSLVSCVLLLSPAPNAGAQCAGDCDGDCAVSISELVRGVCVTLSLGCPCADVFDVNQNGTVAINELIQAVHHALHGCPDECIPAPPCAPPTATPIFSPTPLEFPAPGCCELNGGGCEEQMGAEILNCEGGSPTGRFFIHHSCERSTGRCIAPTPTPRCLASE